MKHFSFLLSISILVLLTSCTKNFDFDGDYSYGGDGIYLGEQSGDQYNEIIENPFINTSDEAVSTFSIDADGASYANMRRWIEQDHQLPPVDAIRTEELINYFDLNYTFEDSGHPISLNGEVSSCPWTSGNKLIRIGILGRPLPDNNIPNSNFVFLIDVSGSMGGEDRLELLKEGFIVFAQEMQDDDRIAIVTYSGNAGVLLNSTPGSKRNEIIDAIEKLGSGGSTAGAAGIVKAYEIAEDNFIPGGNNRIILGTDGDFNVGISSQDELEELIEEKREGGVFLTVLGVGRGNYHDGRMEQLANHGNGTFEYIDKIEQIRKVFLYEAYKFYAVAKDVKVQVEFSTSHVEAYRLIGYENRVLENEDFEDDTKDAGEIGAGQNITALYEIVPKTINQSLEDLPSFSIDFRYKLPEEDESIEMALEVIDAQKSFSEASEQLRFTSSVASFGLLLRDSEYKGDTDYDKILDWTKNAIEYDPYGFREEFRDLVLTAKGL